MQSTLPDQFLDHVRQLASGEDVPVTSLPPAYTWRLLQSALAAVGAEISQEDWTDLDALTIWAEDHERDMRMLKVIISTDMDEAARVDLVFHTFGHLAHEHIRRAEDSHLGTRYEVRRSLWNELPAEVLAEEREADTWAVAARQLLEGVRRAGRAGSTEPSMSRLLGYLRQRFSGGWLWQPLAASTLIGVSTQAKVDEKEVEPKVGLDEASNQLLIEAGPRYASGQAILRDRESHAVKRHAALDSTGIAVVEIPENGTDLELVLVEPARH